MSSAAPSVPCTAIVWSIPPVGAPTTSVSARMEASTKRSRTSSVSSTPMRSSRAVPTEPSSAADDDSPAPGGTLLVDQEASPGT